MPLATLQAISKSYGDKQAVQNVSFEVQEGTLHGLIGPNGAGKTTSLEILAGHRTPDTGIAEFLGHDPSTAHIRRSGELAMQMQSSATFRNLTVRETIRLWARLKNTNLQQAEALIEGLGLHESADVWTVKLSGGQFQRLMAALAMIGSPKLVILDEPTAGLDPNARDLLWELINEKRRHGTTFLISTHSMEEAEDQFDHVTLIDKGRVIDSGRPQDLIRRHVGTSTMSFLAAAEEAESLGLLMKGVSTRIRENGIAEFTSRDISHDLRVVLDARGVPDKLSIEHGRLSDVYRALTNSDWSEIHG